MYSLRHEQLKDGCKKHKKIHHAKCSYKHDHSRVQLLYLTSFYIDIYKCIYFIMIL